MAKRKVAAALRALDAGGYIDRPAREASNEDVLWAMKQLLCGLRHMADERGMIFATADVTASRHFLADVTTGEKGCHGFPDPLRFSGWDRRHVDNQAEGRPIGGQWSDKGVHYRHGYKVREPGK